jgi:hypothetical protein
MSGTGGWILDIVVLAALAVTLAQGFRLSRQFNRIQADRQIFEQLIQSLNLALARADAAIKGIRETAGTSAMGLQEKIARASALGQELEIIVQAGDSLADRLSRLSGESSKAHTATEPEAEDKTPPRSRAEKELIEAMKTKQKT